MTNRRKCMDCKSDNDTKNHVIDSVLSKTKEIERMEND